jgi:hypothetical protein
MSKDSKAVIAEYVSSLSEENLQNLTLRLTEKLCGDLGDALEEISKDKKMDSVFSDAESANDVFDLLDQVRDALHKECKKKGLLLKMSAA